MPNLSDFVIIEEPGEHFIVLTGAYTVLDIYWIAQDILHRYPNLDGIQQIGVYASDADNLIMYWSPENED